MYANGPIDVAFSVVLFLLPLGVVFLGRRLWRTWRGRRVA